MSEVYFIGDLHLGHKAITKYRKQFNSTEEHDDVVMSGVRSVSSKRNSLWLLGDCFFSKGYEGFIEDMVRSWGHIHFVLGNHDCENDERQAIVKGLVACPNVKVYSLASKYGSWISHCPIHPQEMRNRKFNIHGHLHGNVVMDQYGEVDSQYINVSCEHVGFVPISLKKVREIMGERLTNE